MKTTVRWIGGAGLCLLLGSSVAVAAGWNGFATKTVRVDGVPLAGPTPAVVVEGQVFVPVEAVSALFSATVKADTKSDALDILTPLGFGPWDRATAMLPGDTLANAYLSVQFKKDPTPDDLWRLALAMKDGIRRYDGIHVLTSSGTITIHGRDIADWADGKLNNQQFIAGWAFPTTAPAVLPAGTTPSTAVSRAGEVYIGTGLKHWVSSTSDGGRFVKLEDGSMWEISPMDRLDTMLWLVVEDIVVKESGNPAYPYLLVNADENETAEAKLIAK